MKNMILVLIASIGLFAACSSGCKTSPAPPEPNPTNNPPSQVESVLRTAAIVEMSAQLATYAAIRNSPESRPYFEAAVFTINTAIGQGQYDPNVLSNLLSKINVSGNNSDVVYMATVAALAIYRIAWSDAIEKELDKHLYIKPVLVALSNGISMGMNAIATERKIKAMNQTKP